MNSIFTKFGLAESKSIFSVMKNGSNYDFHFILKNLVDKFEKSDFNCLGEKSKKYRLFSVSMDKY